MAITLNATPGDVAANSYATRAEADAYFTDHYDSVKKTTWNTLAPNAKELLLVSATRVVETARFVIDNTPAAVSGQPVRYDGEQELQFPRSLDTDENGDPFFPDNMKMALYEQCIYTMTLDESVLANRLQGVRTDRVGIGDGQIVASQSYDSGAGSSIAPLALEFFRPFLLKSTVKLLRS